MVRLLLCCFLLACQARPALPEGVQGEWATLASTTRLIVSDVGACHTPDGLRVEVSWQLENVGKARESFNWRNKVLLDERGRRFAPEVGESTPELAPGERSPLMKNRYRLPPVGDAVTWHWGLYVDDALQYCVRLRRVSAVACRD